MNDCIYVQVSISFVTSFPTKWFGKNEIQKFVSRKILRTFQSASDLIRVAPEHRQEAHFPNGPAVVSSGLLFGLELLRRVLVPVIIVHQEPGSAPPSYFDYTSCSPKPSETQPLMGPHVDLADLQRYGVHGEQKEREQLRGFGSERKPKVGS